MTRTVLPKTNVVGPYAVAGVACTQTAADAVNGNRFAMSGDDILLAYNSGASGHTVTVSSVPLNGRSGDITADAIAAGEIRAYQRFPMPGWNQADGYLYVSAN